MLLLYRASDASEYIFCVSVHPSDVTLVYLGNKLGNLKRYYANNYRSISAIHKHNLSDLVQGDHFRVWDKTEAAKIDYF